MKNNRRWAVLICGEVRKVFRRYDNAVKYLRELRGEYWYNYDCGIVEHYED